MVAKVVCMSPISETTRLPGATVIGMREEMVHCTSFRLIDWVPLSVIGFGDVANAMLEITISLCLGACLVFVKIMLN